MVGEIVYESGAYQETVELENGATRLVTCQGGGYRPLYRLEYTDERGYPQNAAFHDWPAADSNFQRRSTGE